MKLVKSLLLGSAAGLVAVAGASAADLGVKKPTAVEYVKTCPQYGAGFFVVPGTTSCLKIIGRVRVDYIANNATTRAGDLNTFRARGYVGYDHRTATEYGLLRTYVRAFVNRDNATTGATNLEFAFIQFGGLTVGRVAPVFEHGFLNSFFGISGIGGQSDATYVNSFGYTQSFGGGFSATVALDSGRERQTPAYAAGQAMPDIVASLDYNGSWGSAKLAGAIHQLRAPNSTVDTKYGWALTGAAKVNLPMLSRGSNIWVSGTYAEGSVNYLGFARNAAIGHSNFQFDDAFIVGNRIRLSKTWGVTGGLEVFATPTVRLGVYGTYAYYDPTGAANNVTTYSVFGQAAWLPTAGFLIGAEVGWVGARSGVAALGRAATGDRGNMLGRLRFQRDF